MCANGNANDDGRVVSFDHGCGAHSEVQLSKKQQPVPHARPGARHPELGRAELDEIESC